MVLLMLFNDWEQSYKLGLWIGNCNEMVETILCGDNIYGIASGASLLVILQSDFL